MARRSFPVPAAESLECETLMPQVLLFLQLTNMASRIESIGNRRSVSLR